jgi:hypothetical protein
VAFIDDKVFVVIIAGRCFTKGKFCTIEKSRVNKGFDMLQMSGAKRTYEIRTHGRRTAGVIYEVHEGMEIMFASRLDRLGPDGRFEPSSLHV